MTRKPRNARTDRLTDWRLFVQVYLVDGQYQSTGHIANHLVVHRAHALALCNGHVVLLHGTPGPQVLRRHLGF